MFLPHTDKERQQMLETIGVKTIEELFAAIPQKYRFPELKLPSALTEMEAQAVISDLASTNDNLQEMICFLGAGAYNHYIPAVVDAIIRRGEFLTAYTPYQAEVSQGTLQSIFDFQSLMTALTGMEVSNASHYDGATAVAEAVTMANAHFRGKRNRVILSPALHPHYRQTVRTYHANTGIEFVGDEPSADLRASPESLAELLNENTALVIVQYPDFFGRIYDYTQLAAKAHQAGALFAVSVNPIALGLLKPPSEFGADIVTGEGQPLGIPLSFGGPYLGIFTTRKEYVRRMAGRLVGETVDNRGQKAYVLTLTAREQHIRREKATSNICTNQGLMALAATVYLSLVGKHGLRQVAELCYHKAHYAADQIKAIEGFSLWSDEPFFNEFVVKSPTPPQELNQKLLEYGIIGGYDLEQDYPSLKGYVMFAVTEMNTKEEIDYLVSTLAEVSHA
ncbi:MAG: aminomethyl-transferring glycine dehydrogenase subunit GcvPA [Anaerolineales bacterium]|nr:aminomethyl-transferring glycine dehydrogenase subunit GcvPA [Anaerolineales bacterium]MCS7247184.1 aminomethyl-transferring glycine dehydrogenase subunit GcvPA [Anaerolineales bacterium]MDW8160995.1 aminomethyl-transferring glycine dehydrogenase subunit GcvPA [Anaerolineales bacterium]MDW8446777.1 aminomethyl-transferring glycine dehydrogenase subunit GcvPA [Anaerolineales bacterium]